MERLWIVHAVVLQRERHRERELSSGLDRSAATSRFEDKDTDDIKSAFGML